MTTILDQKINIITTLNAECDGPHLGQGMYSLLTDKLEEARAQGAREERKKIGAVFLTNIFIDENEDENEWYDNLQIKMRDVLADQKTE